MSSQDWNPLSYFRELGTLPKVLLLLGFILLFAGLTQGASAQNRTIILALVLIAFSLSCHYFSHSLWREPGPPYRLRFDWWKVTEGIALFLVTLGFLYWLRVLGRVPEQASISTRPPQVIGSPMPPIPKSEELKPSQPQTKPIKNQSASTKARGNNNVLGSVNQQGTGNTSQLGNNNSQINVGSHSPEEQKRRKDVEDHVASFLNEANNLAAQCWATEAKPELTKLSENWAQRTYSYFATVRPSYAARFDSASGFSFSYTVNGKPMPEPNSHVLDFLKWKMSVLAKILEELTNS